MPGTTTDTPLLAANEGSVAAVDVAASKPPTAPRLVRNIVVLSALNFLWWTGSSSTWATFPEMLLADECVKRDLVYGDGGNCSATFENGTLYRQVQSESSAQLSLFVLVQGLLAVACCPMVGVLGDAFGRRMSVILAALGGIVTALGFWLVPSGAQGGATLMVMLALGSITGSMYSILQGLFASLADMTRHVAEEARTRMFGLVEGALWAGMLVGPVAGGALAEKHVLGLRQSFVFCFGTAVATLLVALLFMEETLEKERRQPFSWRRANPIGSAGLLLTDGRAFAYCVALFFTIAAGSGANTMLPFYANSAFGMSTLDVGGLQSLSFGSAAVGLLFGLPLVMGNRKEDSGAGGAGGGEDNLRARGGNRHRRKGQCLPLSLPPKTIILSSMLAFALSWSALAVLSSTWQLWLAMGCTILNAWSFPVIRVSVANTFGERRYGESLAAVSTVQQLTQLIAPVAFTQIWSALERGATTQKHGSGGGGGSGRWSPVGLPYLIVGGMTALSILIVVLIPPRPPAKGNAAPPAATTSDSGGGENGEGGGDKA